MCQPKAIAPGTRAMSLQKDADGILRAVPVRCGKTHIASGIVGHEKYLTFDNNHVVAETTTTEIIDLTSDNSFASLMQENSEDENDQLEENSETPIPWTWMLSEHLPGDEQFTQSTNGTAVLREEPSEEIEKHLIENHPLSCFSDCTVLTSAVSSEESIEESKKHPLSCFSDCTVVSEDSVGGSEETSKVFAVEDGNESLSFEAFTKLHENLGHPSKAQMELLLKRRMFLETNWRPLLDAFRCSFCTSRSNGRVPSRPKSSFPKETGPGQSLHVDVGEFQHPTEGKFLAVLGADAFSDYAYGDAVTAGTGTRQTSGGS